MYDFYEINKKNYSFYSLMPEKQKEMKSFFVGYNSYSVIFLIIQGENFV